MKSLVLALVLKKKITTTEAKAKELRPFVEKLVTKAKAKSVTSIRLINAKVGKIAGAELISVLGPKYEKRSGGYTRIVKLPRRLSDGSAMAQIEFV